MKNNTTLKKRQDQEVKFKICDCYGPVIGRKRNNTNVYLFSISHQLYLRHATFMYKNVWTVELLCTSRACLPWGVVFTALTPGVIISRRSQVQGYPRTRCLAIWFMRTLFFYFHCLCKSDFSYYNFNFFLHCSYNLLLSRNVANWFSKSSGENQ